jgi:hypothetical protein
METVKMGAALPRSTAPENTPVEMDYFFSAGASSIFFSGAFSTFFFGAFSTFFFGAFSAFFFGAFSTFFFGAFIVLSVGVGFISLSAASVTPAKATVTNRAQIRDSTFFIGITSIGRY